MTEIGKAKIVIEADTSKAVSKIKKDMGDASSSVSKGMMVWLTAMGGVIANFVTSALIKVAELVKEGIKQSIEFAKKYESAFAGVRKTVDATEKEFMELRQSLKEMATEIPVSFEELSHIMELGGQLGVETKNLDKFTKVIAELGVATNLSSEEAAQMLAQFANVTKMDLNDIDKLGSVVVSLGNNFATTEKDIVNFAQRLSGSGQIAGISQANIMGIATAFSSVGVEAEAGGTAVQKVLLDINGAVVGGGDQLEKYTKIMGMTNDEFKQMWNASPEKVFTKFIQSLEGAGKEAQNILTDLDLTDQRLTRGFLSLSQNSEILTDAIEKSNIAREENIALSNEAEQRFATIESQIIMQQNERANTMEEIGQKLTGFVLAWEKIKTTFVEIFGEMTGITGKHNEITNTLDEMVKGLEEDIKELVIQLREGKITTEEYTTSVSKLIQEKERLSRLSAEEAKRIDDLSDRNEKLTDRNKKLEKEMGRYQVRLEELNQIIGIETTKYYKDLEIHLKSMQEEYKNNTIEIAENTIAIENGTNAEAEAIAIAQQRKENLENLAKVQEQSKQNEIALTNAKEAYYNFKVDDSGTRAEMKASAEQAKSLAEVYLGALEAKLALLYSEQTINNVKQGRGPYSTTFSKQILDTNKEIENTKKNIEKLGDTISKMGSSSGSGNSKKTSEEIKAIEKEVDELEDSYKDATKKMEDYNKKVESYNKSVKKFYEDINHEIGKIIEKQKNLKDEYEKTIETINGTRDDNVAENLSDAVASYQEQINEAKKELQKYDLERDVRQQLENEVKALEKNIEDIRKGFSGDGNGIEVDVNGIIADVNARNALKTEAEKQQYDLQKSLAELDAETRREREEARIEYEKQNAELEKQLKLLEVAKQMEVKSEEDLQKLRESDNFKNLTMDEQATLLKYANEKLAFVEQQEEMDEMRREFYTAEYNMMMQNHIVAMQNVKNLSAEYQTLLSQIQQAISAQRELNAMASSSGSGYADGGYTGSGGKFDIAGVVHKGEYVIPQRLMPTLNGVVQQIEDMRLRGYAEGGMVGGQTIMNNQKTQQNTITVNNGLDLKAFLSRAKWKM